jgi:flagellar motor protein MotB
MIGYRHLLLIWALTLPVLAGAEPVDEAGLGEAVERHLSDDEPFAQWAHDPGLLDTQGGDRIETREVLAEDIEIIKLTDVVPPIRFESGVADIPPSYVEQLREVLESMRHLNNVRLHLVGHTDDQPLSDALAGVYGDNSGLSRERAGEVAEFIQTALALPPEAISFEWMADTRPVATNATEEGRALNRRVEVEVWYDEIRPRLATEEVVLHEDIKRVKVCRVETVCKLRYKEGHSHRARVKNLVPPLHFDEERIEPDPRFLAQIRQGLSNLSDKRNVTVKFIGYTDDVPLTGRNASIYGTHLALSKARAHRVALAVREALDLPSSAIASDGRGASQPLASNQTARGRNLNRRIEVEFWHDDPLQELPDEPQLCPDAGAAEVVTRTYDPPWGGIPALQMEGGDPVIPAGYTDDLRRAMEDVSDKANVRLRFIGYTGNERLDRRTALVYGDDIGLSAARARRAMETVAGELELAGEQTEHEGRGYVHSGDVVNAGFIQGDTSHVEVQVVYDELAMLDDYEGVDVTPITRELDVQNPLALNMMRITVDGEPVDDPGRSSADIQRCTDVALERTDIQFRFDNLEADRRLSVTAEPTAVAVRSGEGEGTYGPSADMPADAAVESEGAAMAENDGIVLFRMYSNYGHFIDRAEVRIFDNEQSPQAEPLGVVAVSPDGLARWRPTEHDFDGPVDELKFVLRAYDGQGRFDETTAQPLWVVREDERPEEEGEEASTEQFAASDDPRLLAGYGEDILSVRNIPLSSGTVSVQGSGVPFDHSVYVAGTLVPVDADGNFVSEVILPTGMHTVEVAVLDEEGNGELFLRDLEFKNNDWFYMGIADLTLSADTTSGPADELEGKNAPYEQDSSADGRLAFYVTGKFGEDYKLTASADTGEDSLQNLFSNFMDKSPDSLFRRMDPDYHYPTFGDDGTVEEMAPTMGKFYVRVDQKDNHALWGNFRVDYNENELARIDRGLYGGTARYEALDTTTFGEKRYAIDGFAAEPGTLPSREEFRGTGGSLYFLGRQDILPGSERVRIEVRDKDTGIVSGVVNLRPNADYDIDYLQGRVMLSEPLSSTVDDNLLVRTGGLSGDEAWLVVNYEHTPGFDDIDALTAGAQGHYWINDSVRLGMVVNSNDESEIDNSSIGAADLTLRKSAETWMKLQTARSDGLVSATRSSDDGGFEFGPSEGLTLEDTTANAYRADVSVGLGDVFAGGRGHINLYFQNLDAGYSAQGLNTASDTQQFGGTLTLPVTDKLHVAATADRSDQQDGLEVSSEEVNLGYRFSDRLMLSTGLRHDDRTDRSVLVPVTQEQGERTDAVLQMAYDSQSRWSTYGFVQSTLASDDDREDNGRIGAGGAYRLNERLLIDGEVSGGELGTAGKLGTSYIYSDRTSLYLNYTLDSERNDDGVGGRRGNLVSGVRTRFSDSASVYLEERYEHSDSVTGLTHATGVSLTAFDQWTFGAGSDIGTLEDRETGAEIKRRAGSVRMGYGFDSMQLSSAVEYRYDDTQQLDGIWIDRTTWLFKNNVKYQINPDWRLVGKFYHSDSDSSAGDFYDGGYTEAVMGYAYRPIHHDRLSALAKYTYFYNVPAPDQLGGQPATSAEFIQKSHIAAVDVSYDLTPAWSIGGKYAYRLGQVSLDRENEDFFDNSAHLYIVRADWRFRQSWEGLVEARMLDMTDLDDRRSGALVTLYRYLGDHLKVGLGYNFTDFSDDLTDLSYDQHGVFLNLVGSM